MNPPRPATEADASERILAAAAAIFASIGYEGARVDEIAERAGVNKAMLYYHVGDKQQLYTIVLTSAIERALAALQAAIEPLESPSEKLQAALSTLVRFGSENPVLMPLILREFASGGAHLADEMILRMAGLFRFVSSLLAQGVDAGVFRRTDPLLTHVSIVGSTLFLVASTPVRQRVARIAGVETGGHTPEELAAHVGDLFLRGLEVGAKPKAKPRARRSGAMKATLIALLLLSPLLQACTRVDAQPSGATPPPPRISVAEVVSRDVTEWDEFTGRLEAVNSVAIRPRVSGFVAAVRFDEGAMVKKGDLLFEIDARPFQAEVDRLTAELARVRATVQRAQSELQHAEKLAAEDAMSSEERDRRLAFAKESAAQVSAVEAALRAAELNLEFTRVTSPIDGRVGRAIVTVGNLVSSGPGEATLLTTVVSLDPIYASFDADEQTLQHFTARGNGLPVRMALADEETFPHEGRLDFLDNQINPATGTIRGRAIFRNRDLTLTPGSFVRLRLPGSAAYRALLVQDRAVGTDLDKRYVYIAGADHSIEYRAVQLGPIVDGLRVVRSGLEPGELVVINGLQRVRPGVRIDPVKESMEGRS